MGAPQPIRTLSVDQYLAVERDADVRHEYVEGELFAMAGASRAHNLLTLNVAAALLAHLRGGPCRVMSSDMKVRVEALDRFYYPDVVVACNPVSEEPDEHVETHPVLLVEVLSDTTEAIDRREKRFAYQTLPSLREYLLVEQTHRSLELYRRDGPSWTRMTYGADERVALASIGLETAVADLYLGTGVRA